MRWIARSAWNVAAGMVWLGGVAAGQGFATLEEMRGDDPAAPVFRGVPVDGDSRHVWPAEWEAEFQERARGIIAAQGERKVPAGNTYFENEKRTYGYLMAQALGQRGMDAVRDLQVEDAQREEWHSMTEGIDYYAAFTIKHQMRKYFYFGELLDPDYRARMKEGARAWTEVDPLRRPHPAFRGSGPGWGPDVMNSWVDVRSTENLFLMRVTSVYLMAEETGNRETMEIYRGQLEKYADALFKIGLGEWDSENYHGHSIPPWLNLHDFAKDPEVRALARACLDWMFTAGALKYDRGAFTGPTKRDYTHVQPFGGSAAGMMWVMFGNAPRPPGHWESDEVHMITSNYRAPAEVVRLARREFQKPVEVFASKPPYSATTSLQADVEPEYLETMFYGETFQMGSLASGTSAGATDVNGFKILVHDPEMGAVVLQAVPGPDPAFVGSPRYQEGKVSAENRVAQAGNLAIWLVKDGSSPWLWVIPESVKVTGEGGVVFFECAETWVAVRGLGMAGFSRDAGLSERVAAGEAPLFPGHQVLTAQGGGGAFCGMAVVVGEARSHGSFPEFRKAVLAGAVDESKLDEGIVTLREGSELGIAWADDPRQLAVTRDGVRHDFAEHAGYLYRPADGGRAPVFAEWGKGTITVGGRTWSAK